jgi:hypothetical protein
MRFTQCDVCQGHGTVLSDYNWAEVACPNCRDAGLVCQWSDKTALPNDPAEGKERDRQRAERS